MRTSKICRNKSQDQAAGVRGTWTKGRIRILSAWITERVSHWINGGEIATESILTLVHEYQPIPHILTAFVLVVCGQYTKIAVVVIYRMTARLCSTNPLCLRCKQCETFSFAVSLQPFGRTQSRPR